jgi:DNA/RNA non-specific endonuclease
MCDMMDTSRGGIMLQSRMSDAVQAPAANHKGSQKALEETFRLTNISPQVGKGFNRCRDVR